MIQMPFNTWWENTGLGLLISIVAILSVISLIEWIRFDLSMKTTRKHAPKNREKLSYYDLPVGKAGRDFKGVNFRQVVTVPKDCLMFHSRSTRDIQLKHMHEWARIRGAKLKISIDRWNDEYTVWIEK